MAERRMFAKTIIDSDAFIDMPLSSQSLYFHLSMRGDDDGFINNPKKIQRMIGASDDDLKLLIAKKFIIPFESGIVVIKHWKIHNYIQKDRYKPTLYIEEKSMLETKENKGYTLKNNQCIQNVSEMDTQVRLELGKSKDSIDKNNKKESKKNNYDSIIDELVSDSDIKESLLEFIKMRKLIKAPLTDRALKQLINKLFTLSTKKEEQLQILDNSIINNWKSIYPLKDKQVYTREEIVPDWFNKENNSIDITKEEQEEIENILGELSFEERKEKLQERLRKKYGKEG